jgi:hypothetical protein
MFSHQVFNYLSRYFPADFSVLVAAWGGTI